MKNCEEYQMDISAMLDGELHGEELANTVKHLAGCKSCMAVFGQFVDLQEKVQSQIAPPQVPENAWQEVHEKTSRGRKRAKLIPLQSRFSKIIGIAAAVAIAFLAGYSSRQGALPIAKQNEPILLASDRQGMNDEQFLSLARELLTADPEYYRKMYYILHTLQTENRESSYEPLDGGDQTVRMSEVDGDATDGNEIYKF